MAEETEKQGNKQYLKPYQWKKGQSGNPKGRPPGKTLKEFAREYLMSLPDEEKVEYLESLPTEIVWKMAEGNPENKTDLTTKGEKIDASPLLLELADKLDAIYTGTNITSDGTQASPVDAQTPN